MDIISTVKDKYIKITDSQIKDLFQKQVKLINDVKYKQNQHCSEDEIEIQDLSSKVFSIKENLQCEKQTLEYKNHDLTKHLHHIAELEAEKSRLLEENQSLEVQRNKLKVCKRNLQDQELLDKGRRKYKLYRELTGIRWDFERINENVLGYVSNKRYIHHFCYKNENMKDLSNCLWQEIHKSTIQAGNNEHGKENII